MPEISQITLPNGDTYDLKDAVARAGTSSGGSKGWYGICSTAASTQAKIVDVDSDDNDFELYIGVMVTVKFSNAQTYNGTPTLNVSGSGSFSVMAYGATGETQYSWGAGEVMQFVYDGTYWVAINNMKATTTYYGVTKLDSSTSSTSTTTAATPSAVKAAYDLANGKQNALTFDTTPTSGSSNPVTSGGIYIALENAGGGTTITYGNTDLTAGTSPLATGTFYAYYE